MNIYNEKQLYDLIKEVELLDFPYFETAVNFILDIDLFYLYHFYCHI